MPGARFDANAYPSLLQLIERLRELSGDAAHRAGRDYLRGTSLTQGAVAGSIASAVVIGTTEYRVTLNFETEPVPSCTCPANRRNKYCKHVVAICLALVEKPDLFTIVERVLPPPSQNAPAAHAVRAAPDRARPPCEPSSKPRDWP